ncbi:PrpR N-terminal domain-containing protein [Terribacillus saccharophilus]|uniref:PrpR N-terminal domain-containing protein n=1 Tax=Terribacillus saccharophilus TaxID=361277 RepID=UPI000C9D12BD|nr:PrpR N-terminal domain-containing protein [Terribacillus goriensis]
MPSKVLILSHPKLTNVVQQVMDSTEQLPDVTIRDVHFGHVVDYLNDNLHTIQPQMIITGGAHWTMLDKSAYQSALPILPIPITRYDLLQAALQARQFGPRIAVIHYGEDLQSYQDVVQHLDGEYLFFAYSSKNDATALLASLKQAGIDAIIGSGFICTLADQFEIPSVFLHSKDSIMKILEHVARLETSRTEIEQVTRKWAQEFMRHPLDAYEPASYPAQQWIRQPFQQQKRFKRQPALDNFLYPLEVPACCNEYPYLSVGVVESKEGIGHLTTSLNQLGSASEVDFVYSVREDRAHVLFFSKESGQIEERLKSITTIPDLIAGISSETSKTNNLADKIREAQIALELAKQSNSNKNICLLEQNSPYHMLLPLVRSEAMPEIKLLLPLFGHRNTAKLLEVLRLLLDHGLSVTTVANHLGVSRQTVYGHLERIEALIGLLTEPEKRFALSLELRVQELKTAVEKLDTAQTNAKIFPISM